MSGTLAQPVDGKPGETLKTRLNCYCLTKAELVGPIAEQQKDKVFVKYQQAGGQLWCR